MSRKDDDSFSTPSNSLQDPDEVGTFPRSSRTSPPTPLSEDRPLTAQLSFPVEPALITPNDRRRSFTDGIYHEEPDLVARDRDSIHMNAQAKFYHQKLQDQEQAYSNKVHHLEQEITRLKARAIDPSYVQELETHTEDLWNSNQDLLNQIEALKLENKKLKDTNLWQQKEIDHVWQECKQNGAAIRSVADQKGQFNTKHAELLEQLHTTREANAELYEKCTALEQEIDKLKSQEGIATAISDRLKLISISKEAILGQEEFASVRLALSRLHDELDQSIENRMAQEGTMLFEIEDIKAESDAKQRIIEDLKAQIRRQQDQMEESSAVRRFAPSPTLKSELENTGGLSSVASSVDEITPYGNELQQELKHVKEQLEEEKASNRKLMVYIASRNRETGLDKVLAQQDLQLTSNNMEDNNQGMDRAISDETILESVEKSESQDMLSNSQSQLEERGRENTNTHPETWGEFADRMYNNIWGGLDNDDDDLMWSSSSSTKSGTVNPSGSQAEPSQSGVHINSLPLTIPPPSSRLWAEMLCIGSEYETEIKIDNHPFEVKIRGPLWWSLIIQLLMFMLVPSLAVAWWCIMTASAERELWLAANEITFKKYWDTAVWGAERDLLWRLCYGLGLV